MAERIGTGRNNSQWQRSTGIHEGWAYHFTPESRNWRRRWLSLDGSHLVIYNSEKTSSSNVVVSLNLGQGTIIKDIMFQPNVLGLDIELKTMRGRAEMRSDLFRFTTPNECDLWKAYILGFSYGKVPANLNLLPGQLRDVREAIQDIGPAPPPLPLPHTRPSISNINQTVRMPQRAFQSQNSSDGNPRTGPYSEISTSNLEQHLASADGNLEEGSDVLGKLEKRRAELAMKALDKEVERAPQLAENPMAQGFSGQGVRVSPGTHRWRDLPQPGFADDGEFKHIATCRVLPQKSRTPLVLNNNEIFPFYDDPEKNRVPPSWFINCTREKAEMILTAARAYGNMLMRPSYNINPSETYVISMRRDLPGGLELRHYAVYRTVDGFKLDVVDKHNSMSCLSDVMGFFVRYVGLAAQPLNFQDADGVLNNIAFSGLVLSPKMPLSPPEEAVSRIDSAIGGEMDSSNSAVFADILRTNHGVTSPTASKGEPLNELENLQISDIDTTPMSPAIETGDMVKTSDPLLLETASLSDPQDRGSVLQTSAC